VSKGMILPLIAQGQSLWQAEAEKENNICNLFFLDQNFMNTYRA